jgi:low affinity Fe/Cu permease
LPYLRSNHSGKNFLQILFGVTIFYGLAKMICMSWIYIPVFAIVSSFSKFNCFLLNGVLSLFIFVGLVLLNNRDISVMSNPLISIIIASGLIYLIGATLKNFKIERKSQDRNNVIDN